MGCAKFCLQITELILSCLTDKKRNCSGTSDKKSNILGCSDVDPGDEHAPNVEVHQKIKIKLDKNRCNDLAKGEWQSWSQLELNKIKIYGGGKCIPTCIRLKHLQQMVSVGDMSTEMASFNKKKKPTTTHRWWVWVHKCLIWEHLLLPWCNLPVAI